MLQFVVAVTTSREAWQQFVFVVPVRGGPTVTPPLEDLDGNRNAIHPERSKAITEANGILEVKVKRTE